MNILTASNLSKSYPNKEIFTGLSFKVEKGDKVGLIGINGACLLYTSPSPRD